MFELIIHASLKQRLIVLGVSLLLVIYGALTCARCRSMSSPTSTSPP
jgi:Cu/Ag efflux pump CusA